MKVFSVVDKNGVATQKAIPVISTKDLAGIKIGGANGLGAGVSSFLQNETRMRSGSPGNRVNADRVLLKSKNSPNPKQYIKENFKKDM